MTDPTPTLPLADQLEHIDPTDFLFVLRDTAGKAAEALAAAIKDAQAVYDKLDRIADQAQDVAQLASASDLFPTHHANIPDGAGLVRAEARVELCDVPIGGGRCIRPAGHPHDGHTPGIRHGYTTIVPGDTAGRIRALELENAARELHDAGLRLAPSDVVAVATWLVKRADGIRAESEASS